MAKLMAKVKGNVLLPKFVVPQRYRLMLKPDLDNFTFYGEETAYLNITKPTKEIIFHSAEIEILTASVEGETAKIKYQPKAETVTFTFPKALKGQVELELKFNGTLNDQLKGFYRSKYSHNGKDKYLATTQFEEAGAIGGQGPAAVGGDAGHQAVYRHVQPDRQTVPVDGGPILWVGKGAAAGGDDEMARGKLLEEDRALDGAKVRLAVMREDAGDRVALARFDQLVDVHRLPVEPLRERPRQRGFARRHEPDEIDLVGLHAADEPPRSRRPSSVSKKSGYEIATASAPSMRQGRSAASAAIANAIAMR